MVEVVQPHEEERLAPGERAEERMLHRGVEMSGGVRGEDPREEGGAIPLEDPRAIPPPCAAARLRPRGPASPRGKGAPEARATMAPPK